MRQLKIEQSITNRDYPSLVKYFNDISSYEMITPEEETELAVRIRAGDQQASQKLVQSNLRFVVSVAKQYQNYGLSLIDLIEEGNVGLIKAAQRFDETRGFKFISYAVWWIRQQIQKSIQENGKVIRVPSNKQGLLIRIGRVKSQFIQEYDREPDEEELCELLGCTKKQVHDTLQSRFGVASLDEPLHEDSHAKFSDQLNIDDHSNIEDRQFESSVEKDVVRMITKLPEVEAKIITNYFGLSGGPTLSMNELASRMGLSVERIRQLKAKALKRLREYRADHFKDYLSYH